MKCRKCGNELIDLSNPDDFFRTFEALKILMLTANFLKAKSSDPKLIKQITKLKSMISQFHQILSRQEEAK